MAKQAQVPARLATSDRRIDWLANRTNPLRIRMMPILVCFLALGFWPIPVAAQVTYADQILAFRERYRESLLAQAPTDGPMQSANDLTYLRFFAPDSTYRVVATLQRTPQAEPFDMPTYNGKRVPHVAYGMLSFVIGGQKQMLTVYRDLAVTRLPHYRDRLFLPFKDATSGNESYGGGRYLDLRVGDSQDGQLTLDFNKAYNPYCAYRDGYACPIPPSENTLRIPVRAGEKTYDKSR